MCDAEVCYCGMVLSSLIAFGFIKGFVLSPPPTPLLIQCVHMAIHFGYPDTCSLHTPFGATVSQQITILIGHCSPWDTCNRLVVQETPTDGSDSNWKDWVLTYIDILTYIDTLIH